LNESAFWKYVDSVGTASTGHLDFLDVPGTDRLDPSAANRMLFDEYPKAKHWKWRKIANEEPLLNSLSYLLWTMRYSGHSHGLSDDVLVNVTNPANVVLSFPLDARFRPREYQRPEVRLSDLLRITPPSDALTFFWNAVGSKGKGLFPTLTYLKQDQAICESVAQSLADMHSSAWHDTWRVANSASAAIGIIWHMEGFADIYILPETWVDVLKATKEAYSMSSEADRQKFNLAPTLRAFINHLGEAELSRMCAAQASSRSIVFDSRS
jgi:hypothetical protein